LRFFAPDIISPRKPIRRRAGLVSLFLLACLWISSVEGAYQVTGISFDSSPGEIRVNIRTDGPVAYDYFTMEETEPQLIIDLTDAVHALERYRFEPPATDVIRRVRTSQYRPYPHPVVRVVLDLRDIVPFELSIVDQDLVVALTAPASAPGTGRADGELSGNPVMKPEHAVMTEAGDEPEADIHPDPTVEITVPEKNVSEPDRPETSAPAQAEPSTMESPPPAPAGMEPTEMEPTEMEPAVMESAAAKVEGTEPDTAVSTHQPGSLMDRLMALGIREPVSYHSGGRRDPFVPLPAQQDVEFGQTPLPDVEKLSIVGILQGFDGYRALAQDDEDNGYVLRKGDRVLHGYVARIEAERVIFYLNRRGLDRTVILKIPQ